MRTWHRPLNRSSQGQEQKTQGTDEILSRRTWRYAIVAAVAFAFIAEISTASFAQLRSSTTSKRGFNLSGDVKVGESQAAGDQMPAVLDVILITKGDQVYARQRITPNGRYRFM